MHSCYLLGTTVFPGRLWWRRKKLEKDHASCGYNKCTYTQAFPTWLWSLNVLHVRKLHFLSWLDSLGRIRVPPHQLMEEPFLTSDNSSSKGTKHTKTVRGRKLSGRKRWKLLKIIQTSSQISVLPTETYQLLKVCIRPSHKTPSILSKRQQLFFLLLCPHFSSSVPSSDSLMAYFTPYWFSSLYFISPWPSNSIARLTFQYHPVEKQCWFAFLPDVKQPVYV